MGSRGRYGREEDEDEWQKANNHRYDDLLSASDALFHLLYEFNILDLDEWGVYAEDVDAYIGRVDNTFYKEDWDL